MARTRTPPRRQSRSWIVIRFNCTQISLVCSFLVSIEGAGVIFLSFFYFFLLFSTSFYFVLLFHLGKTSQHAPRLTSTASVQAHTEPTASATPSFLAMLQPRERTLLVRKRSSAICGCGLKSISAWSTATTSSRFVLPNILRICARHSSS